VEMREVRRWRVDGSGFGVAIRILSFSLSLGSRSSDIHMGVLRRESRDAMFCVVVGFKIDVGLCASGVK
jgi:hypothetical protein